MQLSLVLGVRSSPTERPWVGVMLLETMSSQGELWVKAVLSGRALALRPMWLPCVWINTHYMEGLDLCIVPQRQLPDPVTRRQ